MICTVSDQKCFGPILFFKVYKKLVIIMWCRCEALLLLSGALTVIKNSVECKHNKTVDVFVCTSMSHWKKSKQFAICMRIQHEKNPINRNKLCLNLMEIQWHKVLFG